VLFLFLNPFLVFEFLLGIENVDLFLNGVEEFIFFLALANFLVAYWNL
jgi:hypothetical protein